MRKIYENIDYARVGHYQSILESAGVRTLVKNLGSSGAGGELVLVETYPELWVVEDGDYERALEILGPFHRPSMEPGADWTCPQCEEEVPGAFDECWKCQTPRAEE